MNDRWLLTVFISLELQVWVRPKAGSTLALAWCSWTPIAQAQPFAWQQQGQEIPPGEGQPLENLWDSFPCLDPLWKQPKL